MGKASRNKKRGGELSESSRAKSDDERIRLASKAPSLSLIILAALAGVVTFIVFLPALHGEFLLWDDNLYVYENPFIRSLDTQFLKTAFWGFHAGNWHPLTWISHAIDYSIWGLNPLGHHLTNNILHALNTVLVVFLVTQLMGVLKKTEGNNRLLQSFLSDRTIGITGAITGLLFGLHPLHVESVAWVAERKDLLCALFFLLSVTVYTKYAGWIQRELAQDTAVSRLFNARYFLAMGFFVLAILSKPMAVTLPVVLLILDWYPFGRIKSLKTLLRACVEKLPFIALSLISSIATILAQKAGGGMTLTELEPLSTRVLVAVKALVAYFWKILVPLNLVPFYPYPKNVSLLSLEYFFPLVLVTGITIFCFFFSKKQKLWLSVWGYYVITLLPVVGIVQVGGQSMADRYMYLPSLGPFLIIGVIATRVYEKVTALDHWRAMFRMASFSMAITVIVSLSYATVKQIGIWNNSIVFWNYVIEKEPEKVSAAHINLGIAYRSKGQLDMAIEQFQTAVRLKPDNAEVHNSLGDAYSSKGLLDMAMEQYQTALRLKPDYAEAHNNLGNAYASKGQLDMATEQYQTALRLKPDYAEAHNNLGETYRSKGQYDMAIEQCRTALRLKPNYADAHNNLGNAYFSKGLSDMAIEQYQTALKLKPDYADAHNNLGSTYFSKGLLDLAIKQYQTALRLKPNYADAHLNLGLIYLKNGSIEPARTEFEMVLRIKPDHYKARQILNNVIPRQH